MSAPAQQPAYHILHADAPSLSLQPILDLNNRIFGTEADTSNPTSHHGSLPEWQSRLNNPLSIIAYATLPASGPLPVGFVFAHPKQHADLSLPTLHIWLAGVLPASRGTGMFHGLMRQLEEHAHQHGVTRLSVATFPQKFEKMYSILTKTGWSGEKDLGGGKVLLLKELS